MARSCQSDLQGRPRGTWIGMRLAPPPRVPSWPGRRGTHNIMSEPGTLQTRGANIAGDVPLERGVCTDVVIRAYRAVGIDLQKAVHEDMAAHFSSYPRDWGLRTTDRNIDHRRVPNLQRFFSRHGLSLGSDGADADYLPGDLVTWRLPAGVPHIGIVSDRVSAAGTPLVVHNIGAGAREEDVLHEFEITGHYRYRPEGLVPACTEGPPAAD